MKTANKIEACPNFGFSMKTASASALQGANDAVCRHDVLGQFAQLAAEGRNNLPVTGTRILQIAKLFLH